MPSITCLQREVDDWVTSCFGPEKRNDRQERAWRFLEEALELAQACGVTVSEANDLTQYVFNRPAGVVGQEVAGTMMTLLALSNAFELNPGEELKAELERVNIPEVFAKIQAKGQSKPEGPLPQKVGLNSVQLAILKTYENDLVGMDRASLNEELEIVTRVIDDETGWQEALCARLAQMDLEGA